MSRQVCMKGSLEQMEVGRMTRAENDGFLFCFVFFLRGEGSQ